ncbi:MAG: FliH/SctL family protein [Woeseiaceae bacterium]
MSESSGEGSDSPEARRWEMPAIDGTSDNGYLTAADLQELQKQAWDEAFQEGRKEGLKAGAEEIDKRAGRFDELLIALSKPFDRLDGTVEKQLVELSITIVKQLFRRELTADPSHVIGVVREALQLLPVASRTIEVHLHPEDAQLVRDSLSPTAGERAWTIVEDPLISRGGCQVTTDNSQIDAQAETRLNAIVNSIAGDERQS